MKARKKHNVPLSKQGVAELKASRRHITDAEYREQIDALFAKTKAGTAPSTTAEFGP